jgi:lipoprotein
MKKGKLLILVLLPLALASCNNQTLNSFTSGSSVSTTINNTTSTTSQEILPTDIDIQVNGKYILNNGIYDVLVGEEISFTSKVMPENATNKEIVYTISDEHKDEVSLSKDKIKFLKVANEIKINVSVKGTSVNKELIFKVSTLESRFLSSLKNIKDSTKAAELKANKVTFQNSSDNVITAELFKNELIQTTTSGLKIVRQIKNNTYYEYRFDDGYLIEFVKEGITKDSQQKINYIFANNQYGFYTILFGDSGLINDFTKNTGTLKCETTSDGYILSTSSSSKDSITEDVTYLKETLTLNVKENVVTKFDFEKQEFDSETSTTPLATSFIKMSLEGTNKIENANSINEDDFKYGDFTPSIFTSNGKYYVGISYRFDIASDNENASDLVDKITVTKVENDGEYEGDVLTYNSLNETFKVNIAGKAKITFRSQSGVTKTISITTSKQPVNNIIIDQETSQITQGQTIKLSATVYPNTVSQNYVAKITEGDSLALLTKNSDGSYSLTANENATVGATIKVTFEATELKEDGSKAIAEITLTIKEKSSSSDNNLAGEWNAINDDAGYNPVLVLNADGTGTLDFYNVDYFMNSSLTLEWQNDNTNIITKIKELDYNGEEIENQNYIIEESTYTNGVLKIVLGDASDFSLKYTFTFQKA